MMLQLPSIKKEIVLPKLKPELMPAVAGFLGGSLSTLLLHPLDVLKTRQSVFGGSLKQHLRSSADLYRGVGANVLVSSASWGLYFYTFEKIKKSIGNQHDPNAVTMMSAFGAGGLCTLVTNPMTVIRSRMLLTDSNTTRKYTSISSTLKHIIKYEGFRGFYKGFAPNLLNVSHGTIQFVLYDQLKQIWSKEKLEPYESLISCVVSKLIATMVTYPCQNLRVRQQAGELALNSSSRLGQVLMKEGLSGLYRGVVPTLLHVTPNVCVVFLAYEFFV